MPSIQSVIDTILNRVPDALAMDTIKAGDPSQQIKGIATTFLASQAMLAKAVILG